MCVKWSGCVRCVKENKWKKAATFLKIVYIWRNASNVHLSLSLSLSYNPMLINLLCSWVTTYLASGAKMPTNPFASPTSSWRSCPVSAMEYTGHGNFCWEGQASCVSNLVPPHHHHHHYYLCHCRPSTSSSLQ